MSDDSKKMQSMDPVKKQATVNANDMGEGLSPMAPPEAFEPPADVKVDFEDLHPFLQELTTEHVELSEKISGFKKNIFDLKKIPNVDEAIMKDILTFLEFFHEEFVPHNRKEEYQLFRLLNQRLMASGEHSTGTKLFTGIQILEDDHVNAISSGGVILHLVKLMHLIEDEKSLSIIKNQFIQLSSELIELLELHIFREDNIIFGQAQKLLTNEELDMIAADFK